MDGDSTPIKAVTCFLKEVKTRGQLAEVYLFANEPRASKDWKNFLAQEKVSFMQVPQKDTDLALILEVRRRLQAHDCIALLLADADFLPLVKEVVAAGKSCVVKTVRHLPGLEFALKASGASVIPFKTEVKNTAKYICSLHADGSGSVQKTRLTFQTVSIHDHEKMNRVCAELEQLSYRSSRRDPVVASMAKFWYQNGLGDLIVYPRWHAMSSVITAFQRRLKWPPKREDLAFVLPRMPLRDSPCIRHEYGNSTCASYAQGGGPFILKDSPSLVEEMLERMKFLDTSLNRDLDEALEVFTSLSYNQRELRKCGYKYVDGRNRLSAIRAMALSTSCSGCLQTPPSDHEVKEVLSLAGQRPTSPQELHDAMSDFLKSKQLTPKRSYHARVLQCIDIACQRDAALQAKRCGSGAYISGRHPKTDG